MRRRLVQLTVAAAVLTVILFGLPLAVAIGRYAEANELRDLERVGEAAALAVAADLYDSQVVDGLPDHPDDVDLALYGDNGSLMLGNRPSAPGPHVRKAMNAEVSSGQVEDYATLANVAHVTRARISQIAQLTLLAPDIQEEILFLPRVQHGPDPIIERDLRPIAAVADWRVQRKIWRKLKNNI